MKTILTAEQREILEHSVHRAPQGRYCGGGEVVEGMVDIGLMRRLPKVEWTPDTFYVITDKGRERLAEHSI